jgi:hypothetical protein
MREIHAKEEFIRADFFLLIIHQIFHNRCY